MMAPWAAMFGPRIQSLQHVEVVFVSSRAPRRTWCAEGNEIAAS